MSLLVAVLAFTQTITDVRVEGNRRVTAESIRAHAGADSREALPAAFRRLWDTGLFEDVRFEIEDDVLVIVVVEKPLLRSYRFDRASMPPSIPEDALRNALALRENQPFGERDRQSAQDTAQSLLGDDVLVELATTIHADGLVDVVIMVTARSMPTIARLRFDGNESIEASELRAVMESRPKGWTTWLTGRGEFDEARLDEDVERIEAYYHGRGYLDAIATWDVSGSTVTIPIFEGRQYRLHSVAIEPGPLLSEDEVLDWLPAANTIDGAIFDESAIDAVVSRLERHYQNRGYALVRVARERSIVNGDRVALTLRVEEGSVLRVGDITFRGNERHRDRDLRQFLDIDESEPFRQSLVERGVLSLTRLETIADVRPDVDYLTHPGCADVTFHVREVDPFEYLVGGGVNGLQGGSGNGQFIAKSLLGRGDVFRIDADFGNRFQNAAVGYRDPSSLGHRLFLAVDFARADITFPDETSQDTLDVAVRVGGPQGKRWQFAGGYRFAAFTLGTELDDDVPFLSPFLGRRFRTHRASGTLSYESRDRSIFPTRGTGAQVGTELVLGDIGVVRAQAQLTQLVRLHRRHLLSVGGRFAAVAPFASTKAEGLPRFERLFLGTENDMRGFEIRGVGPRGGGVVVGGDRLAYGTAEYQFIAHPRLRLVGFFDVGNVWATDFEGEPLPDLRYDAGVEMQLLAPIWNLPFRAGYGWNLDRLLDEDPGRFFVSLSIRF